MDFDYTNLSGRPSSRLVTGLGLVLPGVRRVQAQVGPWAAWWQEANRRALAAGPAGGPLWVALGDSLTLGIGASAPDRGWVGQLAERLPTHRVVNLSFYGARVADVTERQLPALDALLALGEEPDLVTVVIGSNDLVSRTHRELLPAAAATMLALLPPGTVVGSQPGDQGAPGRFNEVVEAAVRERDLVLAEFRDPRMRTWRGRLADDHFHPNDHGYTGMADIVGEAVGVDAPDGLPG